MVFSDPVFLSVFLPVVALLILLCARVAHSLAILVVSLAFYFWSSGEIVFVLMFSIGFNWAWALLIHRYRHWSLLTVGICVNLAILVYYKYAGFLAEQFGLLFQANLSGNFQDIILPIGISFFTFQSISYLMDVYRQDTRPEAHLVRYGAYLSFFPQLIAGPIVRFRDVRAQYASPAINLENLSAGLARFSHGLLKKVLIADSAGAIADACFALPVEQYGMAVCWLGALAYTVQIYFDFSGYSDMAIGLGLIFGIRFNENFKHPYSATTITEFWRRWHISLSTWFRDYLYIPLGGNRAGKYTTFRNLLLVFAVTGLWHGAAWTFLIWGMYHGIFLLVERILLRNPGAQEEPFYLRLVYLMPVVIIGWVIFRADTFSQVLSFLGYMLVPVETGGFLLPDAVSRELTPFRLWATVAGCSIFFAGRDQILGAYIGSGQINGKVVSLRLLACLVGLPCALLLAFSSSFSPFLYFRF